MLHLELPHVNVLSKVDLLRHYGGLGGRRALRLLRACSGLAQGLLWVCCELAVGFLTLPKEGRGTTCQLSSSHTSVRGSTSIHAPEMRGRETDHWPPPFELYYPPYEL